MAKDIPTSHCLPGGTLFSTLIAPFKFIQTQGVIVMLLEDNNPLRQIYTDERKTPADIALPSWMGYSAGTWQRDTLAIDTIGFNGRSWLDAFGHPSSESMHIVERFRRRDYGHLDGRVRLQKRIIMMRGRSWFRFGVRNHPPVLERPWRKNWSAHV